MSLVEAAKRNTLKSARSLVGLGTLQEMLLAEHKQNGGWKPPVVETTWTDNNALPQILREKIAHEESGTKEQRSGTHLVQKKFLEESSRWISSDA